MMRKKKGFTLIEVMVALMILAIALSAIFRVVYEDNQIAFDLQRKNFAHQVGKFLYGRYQMEYQYSPNPEKRALGTFNKKINLFKKNWLCHTTVSKTAEKNLLNIEIKVYDNENKPPATTIRGFLITNEIA